MVHFSNEGSCSAEETNALTELGSPKTTDRFSISEGIRRFKKSSLRGLQSNKVKWLHTSPAQVCDLKLVTSL